MSPSCFLLPRGGAAAWHGGGAIVNVSSAAAPGLLREYAGLCRLQGAVDVLTRGLVAGVSAVQDPGQRCVRVSSTPTCMLTAASPAGRDRIKGNIPLQRGGVSLGRSGHRHRLAAVGTRPPTPQVPLSTWLAGADPDPRVVTASAMAPLLLLWWDPTPQQLLPDRQQHGPARSATGRPLPCGRSPERLEAMGRGCGSPDRRA